MRRLRRAPGTMLLPALFVLSLAGHAQDTAPVPQTMEEALHQMSDLAGVIFIGEVTAVRHHDGVQGSSGIVEVDFRVDQAIRGCAAGSTYTLREWAGLWQGGDERYRPGQRLLMLLHTPNAAGISSPVGGMDGAIPLRAPSSTSSLATSATIATAATTSPEPTPALAADLRWIGARLLRPIPYASSTHATDAQTATSLTSSKAAAPSPLQQAPVSSIVEMLSAWHQALP